MNSVRSAEKGRALGLGVMGWHTFLQQKNLPFNSVASTVHTRNIFNKIRSRIRISIYGFSCRIWRTIMV